MSYPRKVTPAIDRAWPKIERRGPNECWPWTGACNGRARLGKYGHLSRGPGLGHVYAHRLVYEHTYGPVPDGHDVDHLCRNTLCCNPAHLRALPARENQVVVSSSPSSLNRVKTQCKRGHRFTPDNTYVNPTDGKRSCRTCSRSRDLTRPSRRKVVTNPQTKRGKANQRSAQALRRRCLCGKVIAGNPGWWAHLNGSAVQAEPDAHGYSGRA